VPPPRRVDGRDGDERHQPLPGLAALPAHSPPGGDRGRYECLAATRDFGATEGSEAGSLGHPYRALMDFRAAQFTFCKVMRPGEGGFRRRSVTAVPRACGG